MQARKYKNYSPELKDLIIKGGKISLAKKYGIPRNTARYWIEKAKTPQIKKEKFSKNKLMIDELKKDIIRERAKLNLILDFIHEVHLIKMKKALSFEQKKAIILRIENLKSYIKVSECLKLIGICKSTHTRWKNQSNVCPITKATKCKKNISKNQLTRNEIEAIKTLCTQRKYKYLTLTSLYKVAIRNKFLFCSKETWFKYVHKLNLFKIRQKIKTKKKYKIGIRAKRPNEIWHVDITEIKTRDSNKYYLQAIIDNYSRKILNWSIESKKDASSTIQNLLSIVRQNKTYQLMSDKGGENIAKKIKIKFGNNIKQIIARIDTKYSNSIIEVFFRSLKSNYLSKIKLKNLDHLKYLVKSYITKYNTKIPHSISNFLTPSELFRKKSQTPFQVTYSENLALAKQQRVLENSNRCFKNCA